MACMALLNRLEGMVMGQGQDFVRGQSRESQQASAHEASSPVVPSHFLTSRLQKTQSWAAPLGVLVLRVWARAQDTD